MTGPPCYTPSMPHRRQALAVRAAGVLPARVARRLAGAAVETGGGPIEPDLALLLRLVERFRWPEIERMPAAAAQAEARREGAVLAGRRLRVGVRALELPGPAGPLAARLYEAGGDSLIVWLHGGGWVLDDLDSHDTLCRRFARTLGSERARRGLSLRARRSLPGRRRRRARGGPLGA